MLQKFKPGGETCCVVNNYKYHCKFRCAQIKEDAGRLSDSSDTVVGISKLSSNSKHELVGSKGLEWLQDTG